jgi:hypothetical protein
MVLDGVDEVEAEVATAQGTEGLPANLAWLMALTVEGRRQRHGVLSTVTRKLLLTGYSVARIGATRLRTVGH